MIEQDIVLVSAFFDIGRGNNHEFNRSQDIYFKYFEFWSKLKNDLIIFCSSEYAKRILEIRSQFKLEDKTKVIIVDNIYQIEENIFSSFLDIENDESFINFRYLNSKEQPENQAKYNYIMMMKYYFVYEASHYYQNSLLCWFDFGFNHGGKLYYDTNDFNCTWKYDFPTNKVTMFCLKDIQNVSNINVLQKMGTCVMGSPIIIPSNMAKKFWETYRCIIEMLILLDVMDDDQLYLSMMAKTKSIPFNLIQSDWFLPLKQCGMNHLKTKKDEEKKRVTIRTRMKYYRKVLNFLKRQYDLLKKFG